MPLTQKEIIEDHQLLNKNVPEKEFEKWINYTHINQIPKNYYDQVIAFRKDLIYYSSYKFWKTYSQLECYVAFLQLKDLYPLDKNQLPFSLMIYAYEQLYLDSFDQEFKSQSRDDFWNSDSLYDFWTRELRTKTVIPIQMGIKIAPNLIKQELSSFKMINTVFDKIKQTAKNNALILFKIEIGDWVYTEKDKYLNMITGYAIKTKKTPQHLL